MATIASAIKLNDMMSAPLRHIIDAMDGMLTAWNSLESSTSDGLNVGNMESVRANIKLATQGLDNMEEHQKQFNKQVQNGTDVMDGLTGKIMGAVGAFAGLAGLKQLVGLSDTFTQTSARLSMIVDEGTEVEDLTDRIFASAQRARAGYQGMADAVAKLSLNAGDAFKSNDETILFAENLNKLFAIAGTEAASISSATLQLTQALGSGVLRGEEFNAVFEAAPNIMQTVADYMGVPIGKLRGMAQEGQITADIVKNALLSATNEINDQFNDMPMTWGQVWTGVMNSIYYASIPLLQAISWLAGNWSVLQPIVLGVAGALGVYLLATHGISLATKAWTAAQTALNSVMALNPVFLIIMGVILLISLFYAVIAAINKWKDTTFSATGMIMGALATAVAFIWNLFLALIDFILGAVNYIVNPWIAFANFFANLFNDPIGSIIHLFGDLADNILGVIETIASAIDKVFGSDLADSVSGWRDGLKDMIDQAASTHGNGSYEDIADELNLSSEDLGLSRWAYSDAYDTGYDFGEGLEDKVGGMFGADVTEGYTLEALQAGVGDISENTGAISDSLEITHEDLKYLRDIAEQDAINRFTTAEIRVELGGVTNNVNQNTDLDGVMDYFVGATQEAMERVAEGVHD